MKKYMRKHQTLEPIEKNVKNTTPLIDENHGTSGPIKTSMNDWRLEIEDDWIRACQEITGSVFQRHKPSLCFSQGCCRRQAETTSDSH